MIAGDEYEGLKFIRCFSRFATGNALLLFKNFAEFQRARQRINRAIVVYAFETWRPI